MNEIKRRFRVKRIFAMILAVIMTITVLPVTVSAASINDDSLILSSSEEIEQPKYTLDDRRRAEEKSVVYNENVAREAGEYEQFEKALYESIFVIRTEGAEIEETSLAENSDCTMVWQEKTGTGNTDKDYINLQTGDRPIQAGEYRLVVTFPDGTVNKELEFRVNPTPVYANIQIKNIVPGTLQEVAAQKSLIQNLFFMGSDQMGNTYDVYFTTDLSGFETDGDGNLTSKVYPTIVTIGSIQITNASTGKAVPKGEALSADKDYFANITFKYANGENSSVKVTKTNYEFRKVCVPIRFDGLIRPIVDIQLLPKKQGEESEEASIMPKFLTYEYTGKPITNPVEGKDYSVKVRLNEQSVDKKGNPIVDENGNAVYKEVSDAKTITGWYSEQYGYWNEDGSWCPDYCGHDKDKMDAAPTETGTYYYVFSYEGKKGVYDRSYGEIEVVIQPAELTIVPKVDKNQKFYAGMTSGEVLSKVRYEALNAKGKPVNVNWGISGEDKYEPVFIIEKKVAADPYENEISMPAISETGGKTAEALKYSYVSLEYGEKIKKGEEYRIRFTGKKCFDHESHYYCRHDIDINAPVDSSDINYVVNTKDLKNILLKVSEEFSAAIDVTGIYQEGAGKSFEEPITKVYGEGGLYSKRSDYKKAVVKSADGKVLAKNTDSKLQYRWEELNWSVHDWDLDTDEIPEESDWYTWYGSSNECPKDAGYYRLVISYRDNTNSYYAESREIYYKIEPQNFKVIPTKASSAFYGCGISEYLDDADFECEFWTVPDLGEGKQLDWCAGEDYDNIYWNIEKKTEDSDVWTYVDDDEEFTEDVSYRLVVDEIELNWKVENNYIDSYIYEPIKIIPKKMGDIELKIETVSGNDCITKAYDGEGIDIMSYFVDGSIKILNAENNKDVTAEIIQSEDFSVKWWSPYEYEKADWDSWGDIIKETEGYIEEPVNGGQYDLHIDFRGSEKYQKFSDSKITAKITPVEIRAKLPINKPVAAGSSLADSCERNKIEFTGWIPADEEAFVYQKYLVDQFPDYYYTYGWPAIEAFSYVAYGSDGSVVTADAGKYKGNVNYHIKYDSVLLREPYSRNYYLKDGDFKFKAVRGSSKAEGTAVTLNHDNEAVQLFKVGVYDEIKNENGKYIHTVVPMAAIPYYNRVWNASAGKNQLGEMQNGYFIAIKIVLPVEYDDIYDGGMTFFENSIRNAGGFIAWDAMKNANGIIAVFNAAKKDKKEFDIQWAEDHMEHFVLDFTKAEFLANLERAVAPKTIAFNGPKKKMVVGEEQQLDVKLTKVQESDIVYLIYDVDEAGKDIVCVNEEGYVVALKPGKATVTVRSARKNDKGKSVVIKPEKKASVKITVTEVTTPKIKKLAATDTTAQVIFPNMSDGGRVNCYVLEGADRTEEEFKKAIQTSNSYGIYSYYDYIYGYGTSNVWAGSSGTPRFYDSKTKCIDIRNLKADTEYTVYLCNANKSRTLQDDCKVTASTKGVTKSFKTTLPQIQKLHFDYADGGDSKIKWNEEQKAYEVELKEKNAVIKVSGWYGGDWDPAEEVWSTQEKLSLPLSKEQQKQYVNPKLSYSVDNPALATIDKKGNLKLKGAGSIWITVKDSVTNVAIYGRINITAKADGIEGKDVKLQVGQGISLSELLIYKEEGTILTGNYDRNVVADETVKSAVEKQKEYFKLVGDTVIAIKEGGILSLVLKDLAVGDMEATATIKSTALEPVKKLKASRITDQYFDIEFAYTGYADAFRIEVTDARGDLIRSAYLPKANIYNPLTKKFEYRIFGLTKKSKYNVSVTALYADRESKKVKKSVTTTRLPASYETVSGNENGGVDIRVAKTVEQQQDGYKTEMKDIKDNGLLISGNTYTIVLDGKKLNDGSKYAATDKLTWSSTDTKVATVKANPGTYTASLKAVRYGTTTISVKSTITKTVIAQWTIYINPVGTADGYYGDNEILGRNGKGKNNPGGLMAHVSVESGQYKQLCFTAPEAGEYRFYSTSDDDTSVWVFNHEILNSQSKNYLDYNKIAYDDDGGEGSNFSSKQYLSKGQTIYLAVGGFELMNPVDGDVYVQFEY